MARRNMYGGHGRRSYGRDPYRSRSHDRRSRNRDHGSRGHGGSHSTWWVWPLIVAAVVMWGSSQQGGGKSGPSKSPDRGGLSTVCTEHFRGGC